MSRIATTLLLIIFFLKGNATILSVPSQHPTIQTAINASISGDTIVVAPGVYFENINYRGRNIFLTSLYYLSGDTSYISSTVINGSTPIHADTASCVIFTSGEDSTAVLQGFTITGGNGSAWVDIHSGSTFREGGGILVELSSPSILHNIIIYNNATNTIGMSGAGGGGIRVSDGTPIIRNNIIMYNQGLYGPGIVLYHSGVQLQNNIIASNTGGLSYYGGSAVWIVDDLGTAPKIVENNTIINNVSQATNGTGGILIWGATNVTVRNNIVRFNFPAIQIKLIGATAVITYNNVTGNFPQGGNISDDPLLDPVCNELIPGSPCIDSGDSSTIYNDLISSPGTAAYPSQGSERNDMGAYGGRYATLLNCIESVSAIDAQSGDSHIIKTYPNPSASFILMEGVQQMTEVQVLSVTGQKMLEVQTKPLTDETYRLLLPDLTDGIYIALIRFSDGSTASKKIEVVR